MQRTKGKVGEREVAAVIRDLTGWDVRRRVRQHEGDSDLLGVAGWGVEVKRRKTATRAEVATWWAQTVAQAGSDLPVLFYRPNRGEWRAVWPLFVLLAPAAADTWRDIAWTADTTVAAWATVARDGICTNPSIP